jgi:transcriptional regulator with GAF, ATPase, and Fis domain
MAYIRTDKNPLFRSSTRAFSVPDEIKRELERLRQTSETVIILNRAHLEPVIKSIMQLIGVLSRPFSLLLMKLEMEGSTIGTMSISDEGADRFNEEHAALLSMLHDPIAIATSNALKHHEVLKLKNMLEDDNLFLHQELLRKSGYRIIGKDNGLKNVMAMVLQVSPLDSPVLLLGETGVGKEVLANAIHYSSPRKSGPLIVVNCGAIPENLMDSELFGHEKGAFTNATARKRGRFERAHRGTIFLDEIGDLPLEAQARLLRVLQNKQIERVGGTKYIDLGYKDHRRHPQGSKSNGRTGPVSPGSLVQAQCFSDRNTESKG